MKKLMIACSVASTLAITCRLSAGVTHAGPSAAQPAANLAAPTPGDIIATAKAHLGDRYATIGNSPATGFSCIGFVNYVFAQNGVNVPFDIPAAWNSAPHVAMNQLLPGDVLFFSNTVFAGLSHVAIYIGGGQMIGADNFSVGVTTDRLGDSYWTSHYTGATRPLALSGTSPAPGAGQPTATATPDTGNSGRASATPTATPEAGSGSTRQIVAPTSTATPAPPAAAMAPSGTLLRPLTPTVELYSGPGYQYIALGSANQNNALTVLLAQGAWYSVRDGAFYGWVSASQVAPIGGSDARAAATANRASPAATPTTALSKASFTTTTASTAILYVVDGPLWIRSGPGKSFPQVGSLSLGTAVQVSATHPHWALVTAPGKVTGWVARQYLGQTAPARYAASAPAGATPTQIAATAFVRVTTTTLSVRTQPDDKARVITVLFAGETVQVLARRAGWDQVILRQGTVGWANAAWLTSQTGNGGRGDRAGLGDH